MQAQVNHSERRKHHRFDVKNLAIAVPNRPTSQVGRIINISKGGMAVRYLDQQNWVGGADAVDILIDSSFFITDIPIRYVNDFKIEDEITFSAMNERQCCLKFTSLSTEQEKLLDEFISKHAVGNS